MSWDSSDFTVSGCVLDDQSSIPCRAELSLHHVQICPRAKPANFQIDTAVFFPEDKATYTLKTDNLPALSAEDKNYWSNTSSPPLIFTVHFFIKHRNNCSFTFTFTRQKAFPSPRILQPQQQALTNSTKQSPPLKAYQLVKKFPAF